MHRICALTLYRVYVTSAIVAENEKEMYAIIALLASLEALLGIVNACLPVMKPAFDKMRSGLSTADDSTIKTFMSDRVPRLLRLRHSWNWSVVSNSNNDRHSPSPEPREGAWMKEGSNDSAPKVERMIGMKVANIHVRKDIDVESTLSDDRVLLEQRQEGKHDLW